MTNDLVLNVQTFGAVGDGVTNDAPAINRAAASAAASKRDVYFPAGTYNITDTVTTKARFTFAEGAMIDSDNGSTLQLNKGYNAGLCQVFAMRLKVRIRYWTMNVLHFEHFGAQVLNEPRDPTNQSPNPVIIDSTPAIQKLFLSLQGDYYQPALAHTPAFYASFTVRLLGIYGISDEIKVNPGGYQICGSGAGLFGSGFKWVGPDVPANKDKAMLRLFGPQWAEIDGLMFLGLPCHDEERPADDQRRLFAGIVLQSAGSVPSPFSGEMGRRTTIRRCSFGDSVFSFNIGAGAGYQFQHGIITDGTDGNNDFHIIESCIIVGAEHGITIGNSQNVDTQIINCAVAYAKTAAVWQRNGGELFIDGLYVYHMDAVGTSFFKVGQLNGTQGGPNSRITMRMVGGEVNPGLTSFVHSDYKFGATLFWDLTRCEIALPGHGERPGSETLFLSGSPCSYSMIFDNCDISGKFSLTKERPDQIKLPANDPDRSVIGDGPNFRNLITFRGCRNLQNVLVEDTTIFSLLDVEVQNCMAQSFQAGPWLLSHPPSESNLAQRFMGGISYKKRFSRLNASVVAISLADPALYATTSTLSDKVGIGNAGFGFESELGYKTFLCGTRSQFTLTFRELIPARSVVFGCQIACIESNLLANNNSSLATIYVGDDEDYKRYGSLAGPNGYTAGSVTDRFIPFVTASARDVVVRGVWEIPGEKWTWNNQKVTISNSGFLTAAMVGNRLRVTTGPLAGTETTIRGFSDGALEVADSKSGSGEAVMFIPFAPGKRLLIAPAYFQMMSNSQIMGKAPANLVYAEEIFPV